MATISLGKAPKNFKHVVTVKMLDGTDGSIECVFKYRTTVAYGELVDRLAAEGDPKAGPEALASIFERNRARNGEYLTHILEGWNLDLDFTQENAQQLCDEMPGVMNAIFEAYRVAITAGRLGN